MTGGWAVVPIPQKCKFFILKAIVTNSLHSLTTQEEPARQSLHNTTTSSVTSALTSYDNEDNRLQGR